MKRLILFIFMLMFFHNSMADETVYQKMDVKIKPIEKYGFKGVWFELEVINNNSEAACVNSDVIGLNGGFSNSVFVVRRNGKELGYKGVLEVRPDNYFAPMIFLLKNQKITITFDLSGDYDFSMPGKYEILYEFPNRSVCRKKNFYSDFKSNMIQFEVN